MDRLASKSVLIQPYTTTGGKEIGLVVHNVEEGSYVDRVGELQTADRITEINGMFYFLMLFLYFICYYCYIVGSLFLTVPYSTGCIVVRLYFLISSLLFQVAQQLFEVFESFFSLTVFKIICLVL